MRAPLIRVRTRGQEPCCSSVSELQGGGPSGEGRGGEAQSPDPALPKAHTCPGCPPPAPVLQLTLHREAEGNLLGAQWVLSSAGDFSSISSHYLWYFQDPGAGDGGRLQGWGSPEPAQLCRGVAVSNTEQLQRLALLDGKERGVLQNLEGFGGREGQRQRDGLGKAGTSLLLQCPH